MYSLDGEIYGRIRRAVLVDGKSERASVATNRARATSCGGCTWRKRQGPGRGKEVGTLSNQICAGSSGSGSRTGTSGFSGGLGGSLMGAGEGSEGVRRWWRVGEGVSICVSTNRGHYIKVRFLYARKNGP